MKVKILRQISIKTTATPDGTPAKQIFSIIEYPDGELVLRIDRLFFARGKREIEDHYIRIWKGYGVFYSTYSIKISTLEQAMDKLFDFNVKEEQK